MLTEDVISGWAAKTLATYVTRNLSIQLSLLKQIMTNTSLLAIPHLNTERHLCLLH